MYGDDYIFNCLIYIPQWPYVKAGYFWARQYVCSYGSMAVRIRYPHKYSAKHPCVQLFGNSQGNYFLSAATKPSWNTYGILDTDIINRTIHDVPQTTFRCGCLSRGYHGICRISDLLSGKSFRETALPPLCTFTNVRQTRKKNPARQDSFFLN